MRLNVKHQQPVVRLDDFGDVLTVQDLARLIKRGRRYMETLITLQNKTGVLCLPQEIPGLKYRYTRDSVQRWLKTGVPQIARRKAA